MQESAAMRNASIYHLQTYRKIMEIFEKVMRYCDFNNPRVK